MDLQIFLMIVCMGGLVYLILLQVQIAQLKQENKKLANEAQAYLEMYNELKRKRLAEKPVQEEGIFDVLLEQRKIAEEMLNNAKIEKQYLEKALHEIDIDNV